MCDAYQMVEIAVAWRLELECAEADIVESLVVDAKHLIGVLNLRISKQNQKNKQTTREVET
jgi:hypothetical protein